LAWLRDLEAVSMLSTPQLNNFAFQIVAEMAERDDEIPDLPVACTISEPEMERRKGNRVEETFRRELRDLEETPDGYAFVFEGSERTLEAAATLVGNEAQCCSFARYRIEVDQEFETVTLFFEGPEGTKDLLEAGLFGELDLAPPT
jgi:hypothetical protein